MKPVHSSLAFLLFVSSTLACDTANEPQDSPPGELAVTIRTTGTLPDPDGYVLVIDDYRRLRVAANSDTVISLYAGGHVIRLEELSTPCTVLGENGWLRRVSSNSRAQLQLEVTCLGNGIVVVTTETQGVDRDPDGYDLVWQGEIVRVSDSAPLRLERRPGIYQTMLRGVAGNCSVPDSYWRSVQLKENAELTLSFRVDCSPRPMRTPGDFAAVGQPAYGAVDSDSDLYLMALDGSWEERLTNHPGFEHAPAISPTGDRVAFLRQTTHGAQVVVIDLSTRLEKLVPVETTQAVNWSPDGTRLVIIRNGQLTIADLRDGSIRSLDVLTAHAAYWSPDGTRLAFTAGDPSGNSRVMVINVDGSNQQTLTTEGRREAGPWSPDGKTLLVRVIGPERYCDWGCWDAVELHLLDLASRHEQTIVNYASNVLASQWAPDGDRIFLLQGSAVYSMTLENLEPVLVPQLPGNVFSFAIGRIK